MAELADAENSKFSGLSRVGSSPTNPTKEYQCVLELNVLNVINIVGLGVEDILNMYYMMSQKIKFVLVLDNKKTTNNKDNSIANVT